jgi:hypothetical protein
VAVRRFLSRVSGIPKWLCGDSSHAYPVFLRGCAGIPPGSTVFLKGYVVIHPGYPVFLRGCVGIPPVSTVSPRCFARIPPGSTVFPKG